MLSFLISLKRRSFLSTLRSAILSSTAIIVQIAFLITALDPNTPYTQVVFITYFFHKASVLKTIFYRSVSLNETRYAFRATPSFSFRFTSAITYLLSLKVIEPLDRIIVRAYTFQLISFYKRARSTAVTAILIYIRGLVFQFVFSILSTIFKILLSFSQTTFRGSLFSASLTYQGRVVADISSKARARTS